MTVILHFPNHDHPCSSDLERLKVVLQWFNISSSQSRLPFIHLSFVCLPRSSETDAVNFLLVQKAPPLHQHFPPPYPLLLCVVSLTPLCAHELRMFGDAGELKKNNKPTQADQLHSLPLQAGKKKIRNHILKLSFTTNRSTFLCPIL